MLRRVFLNTYLRAEAEAREQRLPGRFQGVDLKVISVCIIVALSLTMINYVGELVYVLDALDRLGPAGADERLWSGLTNFSNERLAGPIWWACVTVVFYFVVPALFIRLALKEPLSDYGLKLRGAFKDYGLYLLMFVVMFPVVLLVSGAAGFQAKYPFYQMARGESLLPYFWQWEVFYFLQFFALEFFFRGFMLHGLKHRFGYYAVFVMTMPYCMIHFRKPFLEALAAIIAGVILGTLSLKSRSILPGVAIHYSIAIVMDLAALWRKNLLW
ncbi:MAG TPA: CPBP family intramembrane glutamic endopeptidase [Pyrinomonadaceae bacterium]